MQTDRTPPANTIDDDKRIAAEAAVAEVREGMLVGLGTGSTAAHAIAALGRARLRIEAVATSMASERLARDAGIAVRDFTNVAQVDLTIDGADEIDAHCHAVKGAGGAMVREKIVASASARMVVIADGSKRVDRIGAARLPVEVLPFARAFVEKSLAPLFDAVALRTEGAAPTVTDNGNVILDCRGWRVEPAALAAAIAAMPGVVGHGLFLVEVDAAYVATDGVVTRLERRRADG